MSIEIREGFYHRELGPGSRDALSFRHEHAGYSIMRTRLRETAPGSWEFDGPARTLLTGATKETAVARMATLLAEGGWRWSAILR